MSFRIAVTTGPTMELVKREVIKDFLKIYHNEHDAEIDLLNTAVAEILEGELSLHLRQTTVDVFLRRLSMPFTKLPVAPLSSVTGIYYQYDSETYTEWASTNYVVDAGSTRRGPTFRPKKHYVYPDYDCAQPYPIKVTCVLGYASSDDVPERFRLQHLNKIAHFYENRGEVSDRKKTVIPKTEDSLMAQNQWTTFE